MQDPMQDGDAPRPKLSLQTPPLDPLGMAELQSYKQDHRAAADSVFRRP